MKELSETIELMQSEDYRERFKAEYWQVKIRRHALCKIIKKYEAGMLDIKPKCKIDLLMKQIKVMCEYSHLLEVRAEIEGVDLNGETAQ